MAIDGWEACMGRRCGYCMGGRCGYCMGGRCGYCMGGRCSLLHGSVLGAAIDMPEGALLDYIIVRHRYKA